MTNKKENFKQGLKTILETKSEEYKHDALDYTGSMKSLFTPFDSLGIGAGSHNPVDLFVKQVANHHTNMVETFTQHISKINPVLTKLNEEEKITSKETNISTNYFLDAYVKQIEFYLQATEKLQESFTNQINFMYDFNKQFLAGILSSPKKEVAVSIDTEKNN